MNLIESILRAKAEINTRREPEETYVIVSPAMMKDLERAYPDRDWHGVRLPKVAVYPEWRRGKRKAMKNRNMNYAC